MRLGSKWNIQRNELSLVAAQQMDLLWIPRRISISWQIIVT